MRPLFAQMTAFALLIYTPAQAQQRPSSDIVAIVIDATDSICNDRLPIPVGEECLREMAIMTVDALIVHLGARMKHPSLLIDFRASANNLSKLPAVADRYEAQEKEPEEEEKE